MIERSHRSRSASSIFLEARGLAPEARGAFIESACGGDAALAAEVESLTELLALVAPDDRSTTTRAVPDDGDRIAGFRLLSLLGSGAAADVYLAEEEHPRRRVALKVLRSSPDAGSAEWRFEREIAALGRFDHPGIARILRAGTFDSPSGPRAFFATEFVEGMDLLEHARRARLSLREKLALFADVCDAVHHAHQKGVIHRDLKPANILVDGSGRAKVLDFGVARASGPVQLGPEESLRTMPGEIVGTLAYMSPEQASGGAIDAVDVRSDVYSLGVVLYELLAGRLPHPGCGEKAMPEAIHVLLGESDPLPLRKAARGIPAEVSLIAGKALAREADRRYASAAEFAADIRRFLSSEPIVARKASPLYVLAKLARRHKALAAAIALPLVALVLGLVVALRQASLAARQLEETERFADAVELGDLEAEIDRLWPRRPEKLPEFDRWIARAERLAARLPLHEASLETVEREIGSGGAVERASLGARFRLETAGGLVSGIRKLLPRIDEIRERRRRAAAIEAITVADHLADWTAAAATVASDERFPGFALEPVVGLVPLGADPESGLLEFWLEESGARPERDPATGRFRMTGESGIVLVLIPGGRFRMGRLPQPGDRDGGAAPEDSRPVIALEPYFLSKYEMTQGQWLRLTHANPSHFGAAGEADPLALPVERVSHEECVAALPRIGLALPTEAHWERAARGGTDTPWWTGTDPADLTLAENLIPYWTDVRREDRRTLPVGSLRPNPFGLFDVHGNVRERCSDGANDGGGAITSAAGQEPLRARSAMRAYRTACYANEPGSAVAWHHGYSLPDTREEVTGVRPALFLPQ